MAILSGHFVLDDSEMKSTIVEEFERYSKSRGFLIVILCPEGNKYGKYILETFDFWNRYSDKFITILFPGYTGHILTSDGLDGPNGSPMFHFDGFKSAYELLEKKFDWNYSGKADIIGVNVSIVGQQIKWDQNGIFFTIENVDSAGKFDLNSFVVDLITAAKKSVGHDPLDEIAAKSALSMIKNLLLAVLPKQMAEFAIEHAKLSQMGPRRLAKPK